MYLVQLITHLICLGMRSDLDPHSGNTSFELLVAGQDFRLRIGHNHLGSVVCFSTEKFSTEVPLNI